MQSLQRGGDAHRPLRNTDVFPFERTQLSDPHAREQCEQQPEFAGCDVSGKIGDKARLLFAGEHAHLPFFLFGVVDLDMRQRLRDAARRVFQNAVQRHQNVVHRFRGQGCQQFLGKGIHGGGGDVLRQISAEVRLDVLFQHGCIFAVGGNAHLRFAHRQPRIAEKGKVLCGFYLRWRLSRCDRRLAHRHLFLCLTIGSAVAKAIADLSRLLVTADIPRFPATVLSFENVFSLCHIHSSVSYDL